MMPPRVTLTEVAEHAGVSVATVSKVLNGRDDVADATRLRVEQIMNTLGYQSRTELRSTKKRPSVLLILGNADTVDLYSASVLDGMLTEAQKQDVSITVCRAPAPRQINLTFLVQEVTRGGHDGVVVVTPVFTDKDLAYLVRRKIAVAMIDPVDLTHSQGVSVGATNWTGGLTATQYLIEQGHRRIGIVGGPQARLVARARLHGYRAALELAQIPFDPVVVKYGPFVAEAGRTLGGELLDLNPAPTAIFATSDAAALGVMAAARERGLAIPADLSVIGFDDTVAATLAVPPLTTIRQPLGEMGAEAIRAVLAQVRGEEVTVRRVELNTELVVRASVARPHSTR